MTPDQVLTRLGEVPQEERPFVLALINQKMRGEKK